MVIYIKKQKKVKLKIILIIKFIIYKNNAKKHVSKNKIQIVKKK